LKSLQGSFVLFCASFYLCLGEAKHASVLICCLEQVSLKWGFVFISKVYSWRSFCVHSSVSTQSRE